MKEILRGHFSRKVYVKFLNYPEVTMAIYRDISMSGFSCYSPKDIKIGTAIDVELNLKMVSGGKIDDKNPHIATAVCRESVEKKGRRILRFEFVEYSANCLTHLKKAILIIAREHSATEKSPPDSKPAANVSPPQRNSNSSHIVDEIKRITDGLKTGKILPPVLPDVVNEVRQILVHPDKNIDMLCDAIKKDPVISARLISLSNSTFFKGRETCGTVKTAVTRIGLEKTNSLVMAIANKSLYDTKNPRIKALLEKLWLHSLCCGYAAQKISEQVPHTNGDHLFAIGIVHDIGKTVLVKVLGETLSKGEKTDMNEILTMVSHFSPGISGVILRQWKMAKDFVKSATMHGGKNFPKGMNRNVLIINIANELSHKIGYGGALNTIDLSELESVKLLNLDVGNLDNVGEEVRELMTHSNLV